MDAQSDFPDNATSSSWSMSTNSMANNLTTQTTVKDIRDDSHKDIKRIYDIFLMVLICIAMASLGCTIRLKSLKTQLRRPVGIIIGLVCQFIVFPAITFGLAHALKVEKWSAIGMVLLGTSPGGAVSNIFTYYCEGDVTLSVAMTAISTGVGIGMMPLNAWIYTRSWADHETVVPIINIVIALATMLIPVAIGMVILVKLPKVAKWISRIGAVAGFFMVLLAVGVTSYLYPQMYSSGWQLWLAATLLPVLGLSIGYAASSVFCLPHASRRAIAIETGCQNVALCLTLVSLSYGVDVFLTVLVFPEMFGVISIALTMILIGVYHLCKTIRKRMGLNEKKQDTVKEDTCQTEAYGETDKSSCRM